MTNQAIDTSLSTLVDDVKAKAKKIAAIKDWACQECGLLMTLKSAEKACYGLGCTKCGSGDIFLASIEQMAKKSKR